MNRAKNKKIVTIKFQGWLQKWRANKLVANINGFEKTNFVNNTIGIGIA